MGKDFRPNEDIGTTRKGWKLDLFLRLNHVYIQRYELYMVPIASHCICTRCCSMIFRFIYNIHLWQLLEYLPIKKRMLVVYDHTKRQPIPKATRPSRSGPSAKSQVVRRVIPWPGQNSDTATTTTTTTTTRTTTTTTATTATTNTSTLANCIRSSVSLFRGSFSEISSTSTLCQMHVLPFLPYFYGLVEKGHSNHPQFSNEPTRDGEHGMETTSRVSFHEMIASSLKKIQEWLIFVTPVNNWIESGISSTKVNSPTGFVQLRWLVVGLVLQFAGITKLWIEIGLVFPSKPQMSLSFCPFGKNYAVGTWQKGMM